MIAPKKDLFLRRISEGAVLPLTLPIDLPRLSPWEAFQRIYRGPGSWLLESVKGTPRIGRYSFLGAEPFLHLQSASLRQLREALRAVPLARDPRLPPFLGGAVGYFSYDFARRFERLPTLATDDLGLPDCEWFLIDTLIAYDHVEGNAWAVAIPGARMLIQDVPFDQIDWPLAYDQSAERLRMLTETLAYPPVHSPLVTRHSSLATRQWSTFTQEGYEKAVRRCKEYIAAGDIYQANLSQRISEDLGSRSPLSLYEALRAINPSPFAAYLETQSCTLVSSSPERLIRLEGDRAETRPIAGTRPRGASAEEDSALAEELLLHPKERAEHLMLVDLERNDLGRVCSYGTVRVDELMVLEAYSHVRHIVSNVSGTLHPSKDRYDLLKAVFPGGTITGVPKIRCMEIIEELEPVRRGPYTGSLGYLSFAGEMDLNILIRTFVIKDGTAHIQVGAGIVADSIPAREYEETLHKARALLEALGKR